MMLLLLCWFALGLVCYGVVLVGAFRARHTARAGFGAFALLLAPVLIMVSPVLVLRAVLRQRQLQRGSPRAGTRPRRR